MNKKIENLIDELQREAKKSDISILLTVSDDEEMSFLGFGEEGKIARLCLSTEMNLCEELELDSEELKELAFSQMLEEMDMVSNSDVCDTCGAERRELDHKYCVICGTKF